MTPQERKVMELALQALTHGGCPPDCKDGMTDSGGVHPWGEAALIPCPNCQTITAIKEALAQTDQEPVAWVDEYGNAFPLAAKQYSIVGKHWKPLYTTPPHRPWVGLTDEERNAIFELHHTRLGGWDYRGDEVMYDEHFEDATVAIYAKLKQKNGIKE